MDLERNFTKTLATAIDQRASDLYLLPRERAYQLLTLTSGKLELIAQYSLAAGQQLISYLKYQADMAVSEHRRPQTGALRWPHHQGAPIDLRLSTVGDYRGQESLVVRFIYRLTEQYQLMVPDQWTTLQAACQKRGLILFAGPMGSGKTTTMYRLARELKEDHVIMTIDDPVEIDEPAFIQLQVNELAQMGYQDLLRVGLRHRPDIFIIGEIRDPETAQIATRAALSGHLVLATVHARSAAGVLARLRQLGVSEHYLDQTVSLVCYQRLIEQAAGGMAVLFDLLTAAALPSVLAEPTKGGMSDAWQTRLAQAQATGQITAATATRYSAG